MHILTLEFNPATFIYLLNLSTIAYNSLPTVCGSTTECGGTVGGSSSSTYSCYHSEYLSTVHTFILHEFTYT